MDLLDGNFEGTFHGLVAAVPGVGVNREISRIESLCELSVDKWMTYRYRAAGCEIDFAPQSHVLVRRHGIPIHEGYAEVGFRWSKYFDSHGIVPTQRTRDVQFVRSPCPGDLLGVGNQRPVQPDVRAVVDSLKVEPCQSRLPLLWSLKGGTVPP